jgi:hypothetical protein
MADPQPSPNAPLTQEAFLLDRQRMYAAFGGMTFYGAAGVVILLILMAIFLL